MTQDEYHEALEAFFKAVMWQDGWCNSIDGADLQDLAEAKGLIQLREISEPCCEICACAEIYSEDEFPVQCYRYVVPQ